MASKKYSDEDLLKIQTIQDAIVSEMASHKIETSFLDRNNYRVVDDRGLKFQGLFQGEDGVIIVKNDDPGKQLSVLIHEYCHFLQWRDTPDFWDTIERLEDRFEYDQWLKREIEYAKTLSDHVIDLTIWCEFDCEIKATNLMRELGLDKIIDLDEYIRHANATLYWYCDSKTRRYDEPGPGPRKKFSKEMIDAMPNHYNINPMVLPKEVEALFDKHYGFKKVCKLI